MYAHQILEMAQINSDPEICEDVIRYIGTDGRQHEAREGEIVATHPVKELIESKD